MPSAVTVYWRPGCGFCAGLFRSLERLGVEPERRNIWEDEDAADFVRSVAGGNETVPTVTVGDHAMVNPTGPEVMQALAAANEGYTGSYGADPIMDRVRGRIREVFEAPDAAVYLVATGTACNALLLACMSRPWVAQKPKQPKPVDRYSSFEDEEEDSWRTV